MNIFKRLWLRLTRKPTPGWDSIADQVLKDRRELWARIAAGDGLDDHLAQQAFDNQPYIAQSEDGLTGIEEAE